MKKFRFECVVKGIHDVAFDADGNLTLIFYQDMPEDVIEDYADVEDNTELYEEYLGEKRSEMFWDVFDSSIEIVNS